MSEEGLTATITDINDRMRRMVWTGGVGGPEWLALHEEREVARRALWALYTARARAHKEPREPVTRAVTLTEAGRRRIAELLTRCPFPGFGVPPP